MRPDLLALNDDSLAALANRGIVKRATREVAAGSGPVVTDATDGTVTGEFADGTIVTVPSGVTLAAATCTCGSATVCRHRVMVVVAYRDHATAVETEAWSPSEFADDDLAAHVGARAFSAAKRAMRSGFPARIRRPSAADPAPTVELPSVTVRFLVPHELSYARVDAVAGSRQDAIALAVWSFRAADAADPSADVLDISVGTAKTEPNGSGMEVTLPLLADLIANGVVHSGHGLGPAIAQVRRELDRKNLRWPVDTLDEVVDQIEAYGSRSARYHPEQVAACVAELVARHRCIAGGGASLRPTVLGTEEAAHTPLGLLRLTGLGAKLAGDDATRTVEIYLGHAEAGVVLTLARRIDVPEDAEPPTAAELGARKAGGARLSALAGGNVVTESAVRSANRAVRLGESRIARTSVVPSSGAWDDLPAGILTGDLDAEAARLAGLAPYVVRPRILAESVRAVVIDAVETIAYEAGRQRVVATVRAPVGRATVALTHTSAAIGAVDALARALDGTLGRVRYIAGQLRRHGGDIIIEPTAVVVGDQVVVPGFAAAQSVPMPASSGEDTHALSESIAVVAEVVHRGSRHLPPGWNGRADRSAQQLRRLGYEKAATAVSDLAGATRAGSNSLLDIWADTQLRLLVTAEQL